MPKLVLKAAGIVWSALLASCALYLGDEEVLADREISCESVEGVWEWMPPPLDLLLVVGSAAPGSPAAEKRVRDLERIGLVLEYVGRHADLHLAVVDADGRGALRPPGDCGVDGSFLVHGWDQGWACGQEDDFCPVQNHPGDLAGALACLSAPRTGPEIEQPLESMRRALDGRGEGSAGFRRESAFLGVFFLASRDDCSGAVPGYFDSYFGCVQDGLTCDGGPLLREPRAYEACGPRRGLLVRHPDEYVDFLRELGGAAGLDFTFIGVASGPDAPFEVTLNEEGRAHVAPSCAAPEDAAEPEGEMEAKPGVRLRRFAASFPFRHTTASLCDPAVDSILAQLAEGLSRRHPGRTCLPWVDPEGVDPVEPGLGLECSVSFVPWEDPHAETLVPRCPMAAPGVPAPEETPCWWGQIDDTYCGGVAVRLAMTEWMPSGYFRHRCAVPCR